MRGFALLAEDKFTSSIFALRMLHALVIDHTRTSDQFSGVTDGFTISSIEESFAGAGELVTVSIGDGSALVRGTGVPDLSPACISHQQEDRCTQHGGHPPARRHVLY